MSGIPFTSIYPDGPTSAAALAADAAGHPFTNDEYPGMPVGATPVHVDRRLVFAAAGAQDLYAPPPDRKFVCASALAVTSAAVRVAIVDDIDADNRRFFDGDFAANGGASPNFVPVPRPASSAGAMVRVVAGGAATVSVRISGWLQAA